ncbi:MAG: hypothetical protein ABFC63_03730 [Thermoguttaceae bacterium]
MREICALEPAPAQTSEREAAPSWSLCHGVRLLGIVTLLAAIVWGSWLILSPPISRYDVFDPDAIRKNVTKMPPSITWDNWEKIKGGMDRRVDQQYADELAVYHIQLAFPVLAAVVGVGLIFAAIASEKRRQAQAKCG